ncbi:MAG: hypothetical protein U1F36_01495 [Planctomycetota bacterium]
MNSRAGQAGFSMLEAIVVFTIVTALTAMITQSLSSLSSNQRWSERQSEALKKAQVLMDAIGDDLDHAVRVFPECPQSRALLGLLDLGGIAPSSTSLMPLATTRGHFEPDAIGVRETGNLLLIARGETPVVVPTGVGTRTARIDRYRFVLYCLNAHGERLDIDRWESATVVRADDLARLMDPDERAGVIMNLFQSGVAIAWRPDEPDFSQSLFALTRTGTAPRLPPGARIPADVAPPRREMLSHARLQVARNGSGGGVPVPLYAHEFPDYPHGFEIKVDGNGAGRLVYLRLVVRSPEMVDERPVQAVVERVISVREP